MARREETPEEIAAREARLRATQADQADRARKAHELANAKTLEKKREEENNTS